MFKSLKDKLKTALGRMSKEVDRSAVHQDVIAEKITAKSDQDVNRDLVAATEGRRAMGHAAVLAQAEQDTGALDAPRPTGQTILERLQQRLTTINLSDERFEEVFWDLELVLMENNVAVEVVEKIKADLKAQLCTGRVAKKSVDQIILERLRTSIIEVLNVPPVDLVALAKRKAPFVICAIGVNGSGKTTTLAKLAYLFKSQNMSVVMAAADTFRAAAIQQLEEHAKRLNVRLIKQDYQADPAAVAYDAINHARANKINVVLIDTAGRLHSNDDLMQELKKVVRVNNPDFKLFIGESITGNDCVEQAKVFNEAVGIDGIILSKADVDEKGGAAISVAYVTRKPILFLGVGQNYADLEPFNPRIVLESLGLQ